MKQQTEFLIGLQNKARQNNKLLSASIELLSACNCKCIHCYHNEHIQQGLSLDQYKYIVDELKKEGVFDIQLTGGEIFLRSDIFEIIDYIFNSHISIEIFTNATLINQRIAKKLYRKIKSAYVSIYGITPEKYEEVTQTKNTFNKFLAGVDALLDNNIPIQFNVIILKENYQEFDKMIEFCTSKLNCTPNDSRIRVAFNVLPQKNGCDKNVCHSIKGNDFMEGVKKLYWGDKLPKYKEIKSYVPDLNVAPCSAGNWSINVSPTGDISPCMSFPSIFGNILKEPLRDILNNEKSLMHRNINLSDIAGCNKCEHVNFCSICLGQVYTYSNSYSCDQKSDLCRQTQEFVQLLKSVE